MAELKIRVGAAVGAEFTSVFRPLVRAAKDARRQIQAELNSVSPNRRVAYGFYKELVDGARQARRVIEDILGEIRFGVGGGIGTGRTPYSPAVNAARAAVKEQREAARKAERERREQERQEARRRRQQERENERYGRVLNRLSGVGVQIAGLDGVRQKFEELAKSAKDGLDLRTLAAEAERELNRVERAAARAALGLDDSKQPRRNFAYRMGYWAMQNFSPTVPMLSVGKRVISDIASGGGLQFDLGGMVASQVAAEKLATQISNSGYTEGDSGPNGRRVNPRELMAQASQTANEVAMSTMDVLAGIDQFATITGDLQLARDIVRDMGVLAKATGASFDDIMAAAANAANSIEDGADKAESIRRVMAGIAGQGKVGAVEIKDMAVQMAALAAAASQFGGRADDNIILMGAIVQEARARGGSKSAAQTATDLTSLVSTFGKGARAKAFEKLNIATYTASGDLRNIEEIILESLAKTGGDRLKLNALFQDTGARRAVGGFATIYRRSGGGEEGLRAVAAEFDRLRKATMSSAEIQDSYAAAMDTLDSRAQQFQNKLSDVVGKMADRVLPKLLEMQPHAERLVTVFAGLVEWAVDNPFKAVATALGASIAKAGIEQTIRVGIENLFDAASKRGTGGSGGDGASPRRPDGGPGALALFSAGFTIATLAVKAAKIGEAKIERIGEEQAKRQTDEIASNLTAGNVTRQAKAELDRTGGVSPETLEALRKAERDLVNRITVAEGPKSFGEQFLDQFGVLFPDLAQARNRREQEDRESMRQTLADLQRLMRETLKVEVMNMPPPPQTPTTIADLPRTGPMGVPLGPRRMGEL